MDTATLARLDDMPLDDDCCHTMELVARDGDQGMWECCHCAGFELATISRGVRL